MNWDLFDFAIAGTLIGGVTLTYTLLARTQRHTVFRLAVGVALLAAFALVWINAAVGIIGSEHNEANGMYLGVLAIGVIGTLVARFRPSGMAWAFFATALAQTLATVIALVARWGAADPAWPWEVAGLNAFFVALWLLAAWLFRVAARAPSAARP